MASARAISSADAGDSSSRRDARAAVGTSETTSMTTRVIRGTLSAACVCCGTVGGAVVGAIAGAASSRGVVRGAVCGAYAGALTLLETMDLEGDYEGSSEGEVGRGANAETGGEWSAVREDASDGSTRIVAMPFTHAMNFTQVLRMLANGEADRGASAVKVAELPSRTFRRSEGVDAIDGTCAVCLDVFLDGEIVKTLPSCAHEFHEACVDRWLLRRDCCPICRRRASIDVDREQNGDGDSDSSA